MAKSVDIVNKPSLCRKVDCAILSAPGDPCDAGPDVRKLIADDPELGTVLREIMSEVRLPR
ncbi:MAG: hypothetical protein KGM17_08520 [Sphingomonadales bacterium]|nr:hypothetical protein [Sphingomonadales bacterium]